MRRGFTLIELSYVLAVIGLLTAITVPTYDLLLRRAKAAEAPATLGAIAHAEMQHLRDHGTLLACAPQGDVPVEPVVFPSDEPCWKALGIDIEDRVRYRYGVALEGGSFVASAEGDQDGDGVVARFALRGTDLQMDVVDELE